MNTYTFTKEELLAATTPDAFFTHVMRKLKSLGAPLILAKTITGMLSTDDVIVTGYIDSDTDSTGEYITYRWEDYRLGDSTS